jgi:hypothetical protein
MTAEEMGLHAIRDDSQIKRKGHTPYFPSYFLLPIDQILKSNC